MYNSFIDKAIYLDNAASAPLHAGVLAELPEIWRFGHVNPSSRHQHGQAMRQLLKRRARDFCEGEGFQDADIIWTSGGTEANNLALCGLLKAGDLLVSSAAEHASVWQPATRFSHRAIAVDAAGRLDIAALEAALEDQPRLISICLLQNETGVIQDLPAIRRCLDAAGSQALLHVDAVQALGKMAIPWDDARIDLASFSSHKVHGPGGVGALVLRKGISLEPQILGGGQQEGRRSGSLDAAGILSFCRARELLREEAAGKPIQALNEQLRLGLETLCQSKDWPLVFISPLEASPYILNFSLPGFEAAVLVRMIGDEGVMISSGSACSAEKNEPSKVLTAMGLDKAVIHGSLRVSFAYHNSPADVRSFLQVLEKVLESY